MKDVYTVHCTPSQYPVQTQFQYALVKTNLPYDNLQSWAFGVCGFALYFKSYFQVNLTILISYLWVRLSKITTPNQIHLMEHTKMGFFNM